MDHQTFNILLNDALQALDGNHLQEALRITENLLIATNCGAQLEELKGIGESYRYLLDYMVKGTPDPQRKTMYEKFARRCAELLTVSAREQALREEDHFYAKTHRLLAALPSLPADLEGVLKSKPSYRTVFEKIYTSPIWTDGDDECVENYYGATENDDALRALVLSATMLGALEFFDMRKLKFLLRHVADERAMLRVRALVGAVFVLVTHAEMLRRYPEITEQWEALLQHERTRDEFKLLQIQLFVSLETRTAQKMMREEILPSIVETSKKLKTEEWKDGQDFAEKLSEMTTNPEWEQSGAFSKISDSIRKMQDMQRQGVDVYLGSFASLKSRFPFFASAANWFVPFTAKNKELPQGANGRLMEVMETSALFCNTDKFSFSLLFASMPGEQVRMVESQLGGQLAEMERMQLGEDHQRNPFLLALRVYLQDIYRFFKLYAFPTSQHPDPFSKDLLFTNHSLLNRVLDDSETLLEVADVVFRQKHYAISAELFGKVAEMGLASSDNAAELYQKLAFSLQKNKQYLVAIDAYEKALIFAPQSAWTQRQLAQCYGVTGNWKKVSDIYQGMLETSPEDVSLLLKTAQALLSQGLTDEARQFLLKAVYLQESPGEALRALAWCDLMGGKAESAVDSYAKLCENAPTAMDYLNAGHAAWLTNQGEKAVDYYKKSLLKGGKQYAESDFFKEDLDLLHQYGKDDLEIAMMLDAINESMG